MKILRNAPLAWLDKAGSPAIMDNEGNPAGWAPLVAACQATIEIKEDSQEWADAYARWLSGKTPTDDPKWKSGVFMGLV